MERNRNKLIIAAAGSGKTTYIVKEALEQKDRRVLITTYTLANEIEIQRKIIVENRCIPKHITVQTWFSFLLQHGARPYQGHLYENEIKGLVLMNNQSAPYTRESNIEKHYFTDKKHIYSDKLSKFIIKCNESSNGAVIDRLSRIYTHIFIDEVQDLASYDLDILTLLLDSTSNIFLVGDPRQVTYLTHHAQRYKKYRNGLIKDFITEKCNGKCEIDDTSLIINHRCVSTICSLADKLFPSFHQTASGNKDTVDHMGVFLVRKEDTVRYLEIHKPDIQLRFNRKTRVNDKYPVMTFGDSKGLSFDRILIYPTKEFT